MHADDSFPGPAGAVKEPRRDRRARRTGDGRTRNLILLAVVLAALVVVYWLANLGGSAHVPGTFNAARVPGPRSVQVEVINAAGGDGLALRAADALRARGFDVVDVGTRRGRPAETTVVVDRSGNPAAARDVASALGLPAERVMQRLDRKLLLDVTVMLGRDASSLPALRSTDGKEPD